MDKPHILWVEVGFGIAIAVFAAIVVIGQQTATSTYVIMMLAFLAAFILFTVFAEGAAHRAEKRLETAAERFRAPAGGRGAPTGV